MPKNPQKNKIILGRFGSAHGVRGWLSVNSYTDPSDNILSYPNWQRETPAGWETLEITHSQVLHNKIIVKLAGCDDRNQAQHYTNQSIAIERSELPETEAGEYYWHDLIGLEVYSQEQLLGVVKELKETGSNDVLIVQGERERWIPYHKNTIIQVDLVAKRIDVDWDPEF